MKCALSGAPRIGGPFNCLFYSQSHFQQALNSFLTSVGFFDQYDSTSEIFFSATKHFDDQPKAPFMTTGALYLKPETTAKCSFMTSRWRFRFAEAHSSSNDQFCDAQNCADSFLSQLMKGGKFTFFCVYFFAYRKHVPEQLIIYVVFALWKKCAKCLGGLNCTGTILTALHKRPFYAFLLRKENYYYRAGNIQNW